VEHHGTDKEGNCHYHDANMTGYLNQTSFNFTLAGLDKMTGHNKLIVIDNTPLPKSGANPRHTITAQLQLRTDFEMNYNIKTLSIYMGLVVLLLLFVCIALVYLYCKLRSDVKNKTRRLVAESDGEFGNLSEKLN
jgi:hypothetical protein